MVTVVAVMSAHHMVRFRRRHLVEAIVGVLRRRSRRACRGVSRVSSALCSLCRGHSRSGICLGRIRGRLGVLDRFPRSTTAEQQAGTKQRDQRGFHQ